MKKTITTLMLAFTVLAAFSQVKPDTTKKKVYPGIPNATPVTIVLTFPAGTLGDFSIVNQVGIDAITKSDRISALQASQYIAHHQVVLDSLVTKINRYFEADRAKWAQDTLKQKGAKKP